jgi:hypothetical protein
MKIQINGFDNEILTEEQNLMIKILDASGKELSNNTYEQSEEGAGSSEITQPEMGSSEDIVSTQEEETQPGMEDTQTQPETQEEENENEDGEQTMEKLINFPDYETYKKNRKKK